MEQNDFIPLKLNMLQNSNLRIYVKMAKNLVFLDDINKDKKFIEEFILRNKEDEDFFYVKKVDLAEFIKNSSQKIKEAKNAEEASMLLTSAGELMFENIKMQNLSESSITDGFLLVKQTVVGDQKNHLVEIIKNMASNKNIGVQSLVRSMVCYMMAQSLQWQRDKNYQHLIIGSILADIGNVLSPNEPHPKNSLNHLGPFKENSDIYSIISHHHENFDGSGPLGLTRHKIHPLGKLLRVADELALHSQHSLSHGILHVINQEKNLYDKESVYRLYDSLKLKKIIK